MRFSPTLELWVDCGEQGKRNRLQAANPFVVLESVSTDGVLPTRQGAHRDWASLLLRAIHPLDMLRIRPFRVRILAVSAPTNGNAIGPIGGWPFLRFFEYRAAENWPRARLPAPKPGTASDRATR